MLNSEYTFSRDAAAERGTALRYRVAAKPRFCMKFFLLILKNLRRNKLRTFLTCLATMVLVFVVTMIWTMVYFIESYTKEKSGNLKAIVTARFDMTGRMPLSYSDPLSQGAYSKPGDKTPKDSAAWQFYIGTIDAE